MVQAAGSLLVGATYPFRALLVLRRSPRLWRYIVIPVVVNLVVGAAVYASLLYVGLQYIDALLADLSEWALAVGVLVHALLMVGLLVGIGFVLLRFGVVLGSPWYGRLSELVEEECTGEALAVEEGGGAGAVVREVGATLLFEVQKVLVLLVGLPVVGLNVVPGVGSVLAAAGWVTVGVVIVCLDFFDAPLSRRRVSFRVRLRVIRRSLPASGGFGLVCLGLMSIPFLNLLALPLCVTAGTLFFCERVRPALATIAGYEVCSCGSCRECCRQCPN